MKCVGIPVSAAKGNVICEAIDMLVLETKMKRDWADYTALHVTYNMKSHENDSTVLLDLPCAMLQFNLNSARYQLIVLLFFFVQLAYIHNYD